jgi:hypothetical protein
MCTGVALFPCATLLPCTLIAFECGPDLSHLQKVKHQGLEEGERGQNQKNTQAFSIVSRDEGCALVSL